jgi:hypothetical protein
VHPAIRSEREDITSRRSRSHATSPPRMSPGCHRWFQPTLAVWLLNLSASLSSSYRMGAAASTFPSPTCWPVLRTAASGGAHELEIVRHRLRIEAARTVALSGATHVTLTGRGSHTPRRKRSALATSLIQTLGRDWAVGCFHRVCAEQWTALVPPTCKSACRRASSIGGRQHSPLQMARAHCESSSCSPTPPPGPQRGQVLHRAQ